MKSGCAAIEPISAHSRESGNPGAENSATKWVPASAGTNGRAERKSRRTTMIHHISIPARNPRHVTEVLVELFGGRLTGFGPYPNCYIAWVGDDFGTAIEVFPVGTEMFPDAGDGQANFRHRAE